MIGERNSKQSTGSLLVLPKRVDKNQYYREEMNLNLLPHAKNAINQLMEQAIVSGYSSGESIMNQMKKLLCKRDAKFCAIIPLSRKGIFIIVSIWIKNLFLVKKRLKSLRHTYLMMKTVMKGY